MPVVFLSLGSNLGDREKNLRKAVDLLQLADPQISSIYETEPVGDKNQPWFLNIVVMGKTRRVPKRLLVFIENIEKHLGRNMSEKGNLPPRPIDIDMLFYGDIKIQTPRFTIPHPRIAKRKFVLAPLAEIAPDKIHPVLGKSSAQLLKECSDTSIVKAYRHLEFDYGHRRT